MPLDVANHVHKVGKDQLIVSIAVAPEDIVEPLADIGGGRLSGCHTIHKLATDRLGYPSRDAEGGRKGALGGAIKARAYRNVSCSAPDS